MYSTFINRAGWLVAGVLALFVVAAMTGVVRGGPLDPPGAPAPTQKTLDEIPGSWSRALSATGGCTSERFQCVLGDAAVLDRETGLVWEKVPSAAPEASWVAARRNCRQAFVGSRAGWRIPSEEEFATLIFAGAGHPFTPVLGTFYWTATAVSDSPTDARGVQFINASLSGTAGGLSKTDATKLRWCVRGGSADDGL